MTTTTTRTTTPPLGVGWVRQPRNFSPTSSLYSTLSPTAHPRPTDWYDDDDNDDDQDNDKENDQDHDGDVTARAARSSSSLPLGRVSLEHKEAATAADSSPSSYGALSMTLDELATRLGGLGRAQLAWDCYAIGIDPALYFGSVMKLGYDDFETIYDLLPTCRRTQSLGPIALNQLAETYRESTTTTSTSTTTTSVSRVEGGVASLSYLSQSTDGTTKLLLKLADGLEVETVIIPWKGHRSTLCISSQVGCRQGCTFCATGRMGKLRSLTSDEILAQMFFARKICRLYELPPVTNVVFMGMGEPADNAAAVVQATKILTTRSLFQLSASKVTVSTVAPTPQAFATLAQAPCVLAWSVHAANDALRRQLVPTTKYTMAELRQGFVDALLSRPVNARTCMIEVTLIRDVNDGDEQADELADFCLSGIVQAVPGCKLMVNLIPYNNIGGGSDSSFSKYQRPDPERVRAFQERLWNHGLYAHVRATRGDDATAACGQLATTKHKHNLPRP